MSKLGVKGKAAYGIGALGKDFACGIVFTYLMFYFTDVVELSPAFVGGLFLVARMWDAFNDPIMGMIVDNTKTRFGKFRPWILIGTLINSVFLVLLFTKPNLEGISLHIYFAVVYILWGMTYTIMDIPFWAMIPSLSSDKEEREKIAVVPRIFACLAGLLMGTFGLKIVSFLGQGNEIQGYSRFAIGIVIVFIVSSIITVVNVKDSSSLMSKEEKEKIKIKEMIYILKENDQLGIFIKIVLCMNVFGLLIGGMGLYYFTYVIGNIALFPIFTGVSGITEMISLSVFPKLSKIFGREKVFKYSCIAEIIGVALLLVAGIFLPNNIVLIGISCIIFKFGSGLILASSTVMLADIVDYGEYKLGQRNESIIFSAQTLLVKLASAISGWLIGLGLSIFGYVPGVVQSGITIIGMRILMFVIPIGAVIIMYFVYEKQYKLNGNLYNKVSESLKNYESNEEIEKVANLIEEI